MRNFYYYDDSGVKRGPVNELQLKSLISANTVTPRTILETENGQQGLAGQINGLFSPANVYTFPEKRHANENKTTFCSYCGNLISKNAIACPKCGCRIGSEKHINTTLPLVLSIIALIAIPVTCCCAGWFGLLPMIVELPLGIFATVFSCQAMGALSRNDHEIAAAKAKTANILSIISLSIFVISVIIGLIIGFIYGFTFVLLNALG